MQINKPVYIGELVNKLQVMGTLFIIIDKRSLNMYAKDFCSVRTSWSFLNFFYNLNGSWLNSCAENNKSML